MTILGIDIDNLSRGEIRSKVDRFLTEEKFHRIATVNPEFLVEADRNPSFRDALRSADLRVADGIGITLAFLSRGVKLKCRYPGADLMEYLLGKAEREGFAICLTVRKDGLSSYDEIKDSLLLQYPNLIINGMEFEMSNRELALCNQGEFSRLPVAGCQLLLCNFGAPEQELFLESLRANPGNIRLAMGVGGAFDFLTGKQKRAPWWMRAMGLEWLWRLVLQPSRLGRIGRATIVFPFLVWKNRIASLTNERGTRDSAQRP